MKTGAAISTALSIALLLPASAGAQQTERERRAADTGTATLRGAVLQRGFASTARQRAAETAKRAEHRLVAETTTGTDGGFLFSKLRAGGYRVLVAREDAEAYLGSVFVGVGAVVDRDLHQGRRFSPAAC